MAVNVTKKGGIYIEINGDYDQFRKDMQQVKTIAEGSAKDISEAFSGAFSPGQASRMTTDLSRNMDQARRAAQALKADMAQVETTFRQVGQTMKLSGESLEQFVSLQTSAFRTQATTKYTKNLQDIQRATGYSNEKMNELAKSIGGVGNEFSVAATKGKGFSSLLGSVSTSLRGGIITAATAAVAGIGSAVYEYATAAKEGQERTDRYKDAVEALGFTAEKSRKAIDELRGSVEHMSKAEARVNLTQAEKDIATFRSQLEALRSVSYRQSDDMFSYETVYDKNQLNAAINGLLSLKMNAEQYRGAVYNAVAAGDIPEKQVQKFLDLGNAFYAAAQKAGLLKNQVEGVLLAASNINVKLSEVQFDIDKASLGKRSQAMVDGLLKSGLLKRENISLKTGALELIGLDANSEKDIRKLAESYGQLYDKQNAFKLSKTALSADLSQNRAIEQAKTAYDKVLGSVEKLRLKNVELAASLNGDTLSANLAKIEREYTTQIQSLAKETSDLMAKQAEWQKKGMLNDEAKMFIAQTQEQNALLTGQLIIEQEINKEIAKRQGMESALGFSLTGDQEAASKMDAIKTAYDEGIISLEQYQLRLTDVRLELAELHQQMGDSSWTEDINLALSSITEGYRGVTIGLTESFGEFFSGFSQGFADSIGQAIVYGDSLKDSLGNIAREITSSLISSLVQLGIQYAVNAALGQSLAAASMAATTAMGVAQGAALSAAYAPAAAMVSLASYGANAAPAMTGISMTTSLAKIMSVPAFADGGIASRGWAMVGEEGPELVNFSNPGRVYTASDSARMISGDSSNRTSSGGISISFANYGTPQTYDVQQLSPEEVRVIARDEAKNIVQQDAPRVVARDMDNPNSFTSKSFGRNIRAERRRP